MMVLIRRAILFVRIARAMIVVVLGMIMTMLVHGGGHVARVGRKWAAVQADEHAENQDGLEENSHIDAPKIDVRACGSRHFGPVLDMIRHRGFVVICLLPVAMALCDRC